MKSFHTEDMRGRVQGCHSQILVNDDTRTTQRTAWTVVRTLHGSFSLKVDMSAFVDLVNGLSNRVTWLTLGATTFGVASIKWYINCLEFSIFHVWDLAILKENKETKLVITDSSVSQLVHVIGLRIIDTSVLSQVVTPQLSLCFNK